LDYDASKLTPTELFNAYQEKAERMADSLCWHFSVSGALAFQEEARQEALKELWRCANTFEPGKQKLQLKISRGHSDVWGLLFAGDIEATPVPQPSYSNFWIWSVQRVRGRVLDFFRSERLITRIAKSTDENAPKRTSMLYKDRFLSASSAVNPTKHKPNSDNSSYGSFLDLFPSNDVSDYRVTERDARRQVEMILEKADLEIEEVGVVKLYYSERQIDKKEIADLYGKSTTWVTLTLKSAIGKMRSVAQVVTHT
jgi:hypothetical protein